jgi:CheY-like chemotaxis protein
MDGPTIVVADDDEAVRFLVAATFSRRTYRLVQAADGDQALEAARRERPRVVLLDVLMPGPDGYEVCRRIKADPGLRDTAVVVVTSRVDDDARRRVQEAGADAYVPKPFSPAALMKLVDGFAAAS